MPTVLLTGFEPFDGASTNSSWEAVQLVAHEWNGTALLVTACLPVEFGRAGDTLVALIDRHSPDVIIATGVAGGRTKVTPERVALNLANATIPDNAGAQPVDGAIVTGGPDAYFTRLPLRDTIDRIVAAGIPAELSLSAGTYVCNDTMYRMLHHLATRPTISGFIHVPDASELPVASSATALQRAIDAGLDAVGG